MARHAIMSVRIQRTPYGDVKLTSRWMRDRYKLVASGGQTSLGWMFSKNTSSLEKNGNQYRHVFAPAPTLVTVERELQKVCRDWQARWNERLADYNDGLTTEEAPIQSLQQLVTHLRALRKARLKPSTYELDGYCLDRWEKEIDFSILLIDLNYTVIQEAFDRLCALLKPSTANRALCVLKTYLNWAVSEELIPKAPHSKVKKARVHKSHRSIQWWTKEEIEIALSCARDDSNPVNAELLIAVGCYLGLRYEEIIMQRWQDIDLDARRLDTGASIPVCHVVPNGGWEPKNGQSRTVPIRAELLIILKKHRKENGYLLEPEVKHPKRGGTKRVYRYDPKKLWNRVLKAAMTKGVRRITPYSMRHTFASNLIAVGVSDFKIAKWLGHANTDMLHEHYAHLRAYDDDINR